MSEQTTPRFTLNRKMAEAALLQSTAGSSETEVMTPVSNDADADDIYTLVSDAQQNGSIESPEKWGIMIYPVGLVDQLCDVVKVEIRSERGELACQVIDSGTQISTIGDPTLWSGEHPIGRSLAVLDYVIDTANYLADYLIASETVSKKKAAAGKAKQAVANRAEK